MSIEVYKPNIKNNLITYPIRIIDKVHEFKISCDKNCKFNENIDGIVVMLTSIAICNNLTIKSSLPIDEKLYDNLMQLPNVYKKYHSVNNYLIGLIDKEKLQLNMDIPKVKRNPTRNGKIMSVVSLGIDSTYAILKRSDITHIVYIDKLDTSSTIRYFTKNVEYFAGLVNKQLIMIDSNFKKIFSLLKIKGTNYAVFMTDIIIFATLYALNPQTVVFNGTGYEGKNYIPCFYGQHNEVNYLINSNELNTEIVDVIRVKKIKYILQSRPELLNILRVCNDYDGSKNIKKKQRGKNIYYYGTINCTECEKCSKTLAYITMLGYYDYALSFNINDKHNKKNYLDRYNSINDPKIQTLGLESKFSYMVYKNVYDLYKKYGNLNNIDNYTIYFENDECLTKLI